MQYNKINTWVVAPYKKPDRDLPDNETFNNHVSMVRIRSEHAIGFLKGRFHSLKNLRLNITNQTSHMVATFWVAACVGLHAFAMQCEDEERSNEENADTNYKDPFISEGLSESSDEDVNAGQLPRRAQPTGVRLQDAKARREELKRILFRAKEKCQRQRAARGEEWGQWEL